MIKKIKSWNKLIKYIIQNRNKKLSQFKILTTGRELIIYPVEIDGNVPESESLRLDY